MQKLHNFKAILIALALLLVIGLVAVYFVGSSYVFLCGGLHRKDLRELNLQGSKLSRLDAVAQFEDLQMLDLRNTELTADQYETILKLQPNCQILWDIPFQGHALAQDTTELTITHLTQEDVALLDHLPNLEQIDAQACKDYALLQQLQQRHPDCQIQYSVTISGQAFDSLATSLTLENPQVEELTQLLPYMTQAEEVLLTGILPAPEELEQLQLDFPGIYFLWETDLDGITVSSDAQLLDLRTVKLDNTAQLESLLPGFPNLTQVDLRGCGLENDAIVALAKKFPHITFLREITVAGLAFSSDVEEIDISGQQVADVAQIEELLPYFPNLKKVIMSNCGVDSETMDALNNRHADIRFVWTVNLGDLAVRTDETYFMPVKYDVQVNTEDLRELRYCTDMICIDIGHMPVANCEWAAYMPNLQYLIIAETQISNISPLKDLKNLIYLEMFLTNVTDVSPLLGCTALQDLNMCFVPCIEYQPILEMTWLKNLWWGGWLMRTYEAQFREALPNTRLCHDSASSTGNGWRELDNYFAMRDILGMWYMTD